MGPAARAAIVISLLAAACGDNRPGPHELAAGRLVVRVIDDPAAIELEVDGVLAWSTTQARPAPFGFAAVGTVDATIEEQFGSFKFTEADPRWRGIDHLTAIADADDHTITFGLAGGGRALGTGTIVLADDAGGFPRHVAITLAVDPAAGDRVALASPCTQGEHVIGLGGQSFDVDHRGQVVPLWVQEDGIGKVGDPDDVYQGVWFLAGRRHSTHTPMPMALSSRGYAEVVDTDARTTFDVCATRADTLRVDAWSSTLTTRIFLGDRTAAGTAEAAARDALGHMIAWVGRPARPPRHAFLPWVDAIFGSANVRRVAQKLRDLHIPATAIWTEDWRGGVDTSTGYALRENWHVDPTLYPDFDQLADDLHAQGFAFLTYHNTFLDDTADVYAEATQAGYAIHDAAGGLYEFTGVKFNPSTMVDLTNPAAVAWVKQTMGEARTRGADGWMADFAEWLPADAALTAGDARAAEHQRYPTRWATLNRELLATPIAGRPDPIYFMRSAWLGSQSQVQIMWPGDQQTDWTDGDGLPSVIPMEIGLGITGFPYIGGDIAGYMSQGTTPTTEELFYRWTTFGALQPVMRTHHGRSARDNFQWEHDAASIAHFQRWTRLHAQLAAYLWGSIGAFERDGLPLVRAIALDYPEEDWAWSSRDQYLLGDRILVAPIQVQGATTREVALPVGTWYPLLGGGGAIAGGGTITATAAKEDLPAYVPAGALLVLYPDGVDTTLPVTAGAATMAGDDREVWVWPGAAAHADVARWNDDRGIDGTAQWTWGGRDAAAGLPAHATFAGNVVPITIGDGFVTATVVGDGTLTFDNGGTLVIARGLPHAKTIVRLATR